MNVPENLKYTKDHEWVATDGKVGITDYAQEALGDVVFVELPAVGQSVNAGDAFGVVESVKSVSDLYSPIAGKVVAVNQELTARPELVNEDPYGHGWIVQIESTAEEGALLSPQAYKSQIEGA